MFMLLMLLTSGLKIKTFEMVFLCYKHTHALQNKTFNVLCAQSAKTFAGVGFQKW